MALTPMMKQYFLMKEEYKECILLYRLGDFYEMFYDDAILVSKELDLTLTGRNCGEETKAPMCGVPYHAVNQYINRLIEKGHKVAICEQVTKPSAKGIVQREVVKVITAGTLVETDMLTEDKSNFVLAITEKNGKFALAWCDISVGEIFCWEGKDKGDVSEVSEMILDIAPAEIIARSSVKQYYFAIADKEIVPQFQSYYEWAFSEDNGVKKVKKQLGVSTLEAFEIKNTGIYSACGALLEYIEETQKRSLAHLDKLSVVRKSEHLRIDSNTKRNLEILQSNRDGKPYGSILWLLSKTQTSMGARQLKEVLNSPQISIGKIEARHDIVESLVENNIKREKVKNLLSDVRDIFRISGKISLGNVEPKDLIALQTSLGILPQLKEVLKSFGSQEMTKLESRISVFPAVHEAIAKTIDSELKGNLRDGGYILKNFNSELELLANLTKNTQTVINEMQTREREKTQIKNLRIKENKVYGYFIEVSKQHQDMVPLGYVRKQTVANCERYITEELKELEEKIYSAKEKSIALEEEIYAQLISFLSGFIGSMQETAMLIANLDVLLAFAIVSRENGYVRPQMTTADSLEIEGGRHPIVEILQKKEIFVANDTHLNTTDSRTIILTGPNMAGKSTYMRQIAIITYLAHLGCFVPAKRATVPICDRIFTRIGASDNLINDQSTFMVEMVEVSNILQNATKNSLVILDEVGRGTSTMDGLSIAFAVTKYITEKIKAKTIFATHYHELTELENVSEGIKNYKILVKEQSGKIVFLRKITRGRAERSFGIEVASLAGLPKEVLKNAKKILKDLESVELTCVQGKIDFDALEKEDAPQIPQEYITACEEILSLNLDDLSPRNAYETLARIKEELEK
ncbi:MAG: DNA mismatch repair protein MutS [Bacillota bacterium]